MWSIWKFVFDNGESRYKWSLEQIMDNVVYVELCFVTSIGSNAKG
jgi:hypothetical protein